MFIHRHLITSAILAGCLVTACTSLQETSPLITAIKARDTAAIDKLLADGADVNGAVRDGMTPLIAAAVMADEALMARLLDAGARIGDKDASDKSAVMYAAYHGDFVDVRLLLDRGASVDDLQKVSGFMPLHESCLSGTVDLEAVRYYLGRGFKADAAGPDGATPLHCAARHALGDYAALLVTEKAAPNAVDTNGQTPLHLAAASGQANLAFVKQLVGLGAKVDIRDKDGKTPADLVNTAQHQDVADFLMAVASGAGEK